MRSVGAFEAKNRLGALLDLVEQGEEITITRHGKAAARLVAAKDVAGQTAAASAAAERIAQRARGLSLGAIAVKDLIEDGRR